jgi:hypothetical protein
MDKIHQRYGVPSSKPGLEITPTWLGLRSSVCHALFWAPIFLQTSVLLASGLGYFADFTACGKTGYQRLILCQDMLRKKPALKLICVRA